MTQTQEQLLFSLEQVNTKLVEARSYLSSLKKELANVETDIISLNIRRDALKEEIRIQRNATVHEEITDRQNDIERFRKLLPELLEKVK